MSNSVKSVSSSPSDQVNNQINLLLTESAMGKEREVNKDSLYLESLARYKELKSIGSCLHGDCDSDGLIKPDWFDQKLFDKGKSLGQKYFFSSFFGHLCGVYVLVQVPSIYQPLLTTGNSRTVASLFARYLSTLNHVKIWYDGDVWNPSDPAHRSIVSVRKGHKLVSSRLNLGKRQGIDTLAISQFDMFLTLWAFVGNTFLHPQETGFPDDLETMKAYLHFWRTIGYLLGVQDKFNICNDDNMDRADSMINLVWDQEFKPLLIAHLNQNSGQDKGQIMCDSIIEAMRSVLPILSTSAFIKYFHEIHSIKSTVKLDKTHDKVSYKLMKVTMNNLLPSLIADSIANFYLKRSLDNCNKNRVKIAKSLEGIGPINESDKQQVDQSIDQNPL